MSLYFFHSLLTEVANHFMPNMGFSAGCYCHDTTRHAWQVLLTTTHCRFAVSHLYHVLALLQRRQKREREPGVQFNIYVPLWLSSAPGCSVNTLCYKLLNSSGVPAVSPLSLLKVGRSALINLDQCIVMRSSRHALRILNSAHLSLSYIFLCIVATV